jgi:hypothetical protein
MKNSLYLHLDTSEMPNKIGRYINYLCYFNKFLNLSSS